MIRSELLNDNTLIKHWSDRFLMLLQEETGAKYSEPVDINPCPYTYTEVEGEFAYEQYDKEREYMKGERVMFGVDAYESLVDNNTDSPINTENWLKL